MNREITVTFPCAVGTVVYTAEHGEKTECRVCALEYVSDKVQKLHVYETDRLDKKRVYLATDLGKKLFFDEAEAKAVLKETAKKKKS